MECLEEIAYDEEFLFLLYREMDHWFEERMIRWPERLAFNKAKFIELYKQETVYIEVVLPLIPRTSQKTTEQEDHATLEHPVVGLHAFSESKQPLQVINKPLGWSNRLI
jgi:hypothetical protein